MHLCSNASINRRKNKNVSEGTEKSSLKTFDDPDPLFPNFSLLVSMTTIKWTGLLHKILTFYWELLMETFWLNFVETYWIEWPKSPFSMVIFHYVYFFFFFFFFFFFIYLFIYLFFFFFDLFIFFFLLPWQQTFKINLVNKTSFDSYCVWMLYVKFGKILYNIFITIFRNYCVWWSGWGNFLLYYQKFFRSHVSNCVQE